MNLNTQMILLLWNCRGTCDNEFLLNYKDLLATYKPSLVILTEMKIYDDKTKDILPRFGFKNYLTSPAEGNSGGIAVLWDDMIDLELIGHSRQELHIKVKFSTKIVYTLFATCCLNSIHAKHILWDNLYQFSNTVTTPWLLVGDFNQIANNGEKYGGRKPSIKKYLIS